MSKITKIKKALASKLINKTIYFNTTLAWKPQYYSKLKLFDNLYSINSVVLSKCSLIDLILKTHSLDSLQKNLYNK